VAPPPGAAYQTTPVAPVEAPAATPPAAPQGALDLSDPATRMLASLPDDVEDVTWALSTAAALWGRGELKEAKACAVREEGDFRTYWHLVQGLTAYARGFEYVDARIDLERRAGKILNQFLS
jgi:hypothetical protein